MTNHRTQRGFTLIELMLVVAITAMVMTVVAVGFQALLGAREAVNSLGDSTEAGPRILTMVERDLLGLWHHDVKGNKVLIGRNYDIAGNDADRIDFLTTTDAVGPVLDGQGQPRQPSICEVGYWIRENKEIPGLLELWRREDPMVDDNLLTGGTFQLVHDRLKSFNVTYFETLGHDAEPLVDWDSSKTDALPRRIKIEFTLERKLANRNEVSQAEIQDFEASTKRYTREVVFDRRIPDILKAGIAMVPVFPGKPADAGGGGGGPGGAGGQSGGGGPGQGRGPGGDGGRGGPGGIVPGQRGGNTRQPGQGQQGRNPGGQRGGQGAPPGGEFRPPGGNNPPININELLRGSGGGNPFGGRGGGR